jgi:drug/metabolite transporter (DMT)-like permease
MKSNIGGMQKLIGPGSLLLIGILFGLSGVIAKHLSSNLNAYQVVEYRFAIALVAALVVTILLRKKLQFNEHDKKSLLLFAASFPISVVLFTLAIFNTSVALAVFSFYIATLLSSFALGWLFFEEKIHIYKQIALVLMLVAVFIFTDPLGSSTLSIGFLYGILSGIVQGIASSFQKKLSSSTDKLSLLVVQTTAGIILSATILLAIHEPLFIQLSSLNWLIAGVFGVSMLAIIYLFLVGFKHTNLNTGSILVSSELLFGPLFALILLGEALGGRVIFGGIFTIIAALLANLAAPQNK